MTGITDADLLGITGCAVVGQSGETIGKLTDVRLDDASGLAEWGVVKTGTLLGGFKLIPLVAARRRGDDVLVPFSKDTVKHAPDVPDPAFITETEEMRLYTHYGVAFSAAPTDPRANAPVIHSQPGSAPTPRGAKPEPSPDPAGGRWGRGGPATGYTKKEVYTRAQELGVPGRGSMTKQQLYDAVRAAGG